METRIILGSENNFDRAQAALDHIRQHVKELELHALEIKPYKKDRSTQANAYYWAAVVNPIASHLGYTPSEMHNELLGAVFGWRVFVGLDKRERQIPNRRTTEPEKMNTAEFAQYIERCHQIAADLGIYIEPWSGQ